MGTIGARAPKLTRMPVERSCEIEPRTGPVAANLKERKTEGRTVSTSARAIGIETGPMERKGWPNASSAFPSTHVTVPVAERSMSPERSCAATAEPGRKAVAPADEAVDAAAPVGTAIQPAA